jgi:hypothetical protein
VILVPVPERLAVSVELSGSFDSMDSVAVFAPSTEGSNITVIVFEVPAARVWPDALSPDFTNWAASVPVIVTVPMVKLAEPVFCIVKVWAGLASELIPTEPKVLDAGDTVISGAAVVVPVPVRLTFSAGLSGSFDGIESVAVFAPTAEGSNVTVSVFEVPAARVWPDAVSPDFANWAASVPVIVTVPMVRLAEPVFCIVKT